MHRRDFRRVAGLLVGQIHGVERLSLCQSLGTSPPPLPLGGTVEQITTRRTRYLTRNRIRYIQSDPIRKIKMG